MSSSSCKTNIEEEEEDKQMNSKFPTQFQVQIFMYQDNNRENNRPTEIRVTGGQTRTNTVRRLPPIGNSQIDKNLSPRPEPSGSSSKLSRYHSNCQISSISDEHSTAKSNYIPRYLRRERSLGKNEIASTSKQMSSEYVVYYLKTNPTFLERYVLEEVDAEHLEQWLLKKSQKTKTKRDPNKSKQTKLSRWKFSEQSEKTKMLFSLTQSLENNPTKDHILWELATCIASAVDADGFRVYIPDHTESVSMGQYSEEYDNENNIRLLSASSKDNFFSKNSIPYYVCKHKEPITISRSSEDIRFRNGIRKDDAAAHIMCQAIIQSNGEVASIIELYNTNKFRKFHEKDEELATSYLVWGSMALHYTQLYNVLNKQRNLNDFLLAVVKSIFQDMISVDNLVVKIINFTQKLVDADRASLFLVDSQKKELYATIFDVGNDGGSKTKPESDKTNTNEIRFPLGKGIAGQVALTGEILNITDAYSDPRFNRNIDQLTGYKTQTILCMPIYIRGSIIGVVQMVNKHSGYFTKEDEIAFETFGVYCGLALHHAKLYDKIRKSEQKYKVALEVLSYHNTCTEEEISKAFKEGIPENYDGLNNFYFNTLAIDDEEKVRAVLFMFTDLFGLIKFDRNTLIRFILTVKKNYRRVPYHNWTHGFAVCNSMYTIVKRTNRFKFIECLSLYIGALCHDLDHRGKNNKFLSDTESPLASIYSTSTLEHHHFNQTVTILQQDGHNIFSKLSSSEYKYALSLIKHCILATDLALFFPNKDKVQKLIEDNKFNWHSQEHRLLIMAVAMTGSDLCASAKPWEIQTETVRVIFEEFYEQGDAERAAGRKPIPMMDRNQPDEQASSQVGFLTGICIPCYSILSKLLIETAPMLQQINSNLKRWKDLDSEIKAKKLQKDKD